MCWETAVSEYPNPYDEGTMAWSLWEIDRAFRQIGRELARASGIVWLVDRLNDLLAWIESKRRGGS